MVRHRGASGGSDRKYTCNQLTGTRPAFFNRYLDARPLSDELFCKFKTIKRSQFECAVKYLPSN